MLIDIIQDLDIWKEVALLQAASLLGPFVNIWPHRLIVEAVNFIYQIENLMVSGREEYTFYHSVLDDYVEKVAKERKGNHCMQCILTF